MAKYDDATYYLSKGGKVVKVTGWTLRVALGGLAKVAKAGWTILEDKSGK